MGDMITSGRACLNLRDWSAGAEAFAQLGLGLPRYYVCPLCLRGFTEDQAPLLTREHVPPRALGGRRLVLTCRDCNSTAGHQIDSHAAEIERVRDFRRHKPGNSYTAHCQAEGGIGANVEAEWSADGKLSIAGVPETNAPGALDHLNAELTRRWREGRGWPTSSLSVRFRHQVSPRRASVSWLRAAYLAAFASLGYRYAFRKEVDLVRKQIQQPDICLIKSFYQEAPDATASEPAIVLLNQPHWACGLAVQMGEHLVLLPYGDDAVSYYQRLRCAGGDGTPVTFAGKALPWPERAEFRLDYALPSERALYAKIVNGGGETGNAR
ncbi:MAG: HNH endonuclease [Proteobacteria bacterium]|nr:HNH endonuclease [Pseudomonadota bacterium]